MANEDHTPTTADLWKLVQQQAEELACIKTELRRNGEEGGGGRGGQAGDRQGQGSERRVSRAVLLKAATAGAAGLTGVALAGSLGGGSALARTEDSNFQADGFTGIHQQLDDTTGFHAPYTSAFDKGVVAGGATWGVYGAAIDGSGHPTGGIGVFGDTGNGTGVSGHSAGGTGVNGKTESVKDAGVYGFNNNGTADAFSPGVWGYSPSGIGTYGQSGAGDGLKGFTATGTGVVGHSDSGVGVSGDSSAGDSPGVFGSNFSEGGPAVGVKGQAAGVGVYGEGDEVGVRGYGVAGRGGVFTGYAAAISLLPDVIAYQMPNPPDNGRAGDLVVDKNFRLWFCIKTSATGTPRARWKRIQMRWSATHRNRGCSSKQAIHADFARHVR
jgi:hypothetical protein